MAIYKPRTEELEEAKPANTVILEGQKKIDIDNSLCRLVRDSCFNQICPLTYHCYLIKVYVAYSVVGS